MKLLTPTYLLPLFLIASIARVGAGEMPNILLLMGDDHGWDEVAYNGHPHLKTPILDEMAATGLRWIASIRGTHPVRPLEAAF